MSNAPPPIPIVVLAGQSNANSFAIASAAYAAATGAGGMLVHVAVNGSGLDETADSGSGTWHAPEPGGDKGINLQRLCTQLWSILDPASPGYVPGAYLDSVIWVQGEGDAWFAGAATRYQENLQALHEEITRRFGTHDLVIAGLSDAPDANRDFGGTHAAKWDQIQAAQQALADELETVVLVDPDAVAAAGGFSADEMFRSDFVHYDDASGFAGVFGAHLVAAALDLGSDPSPQAPSPHMGSLGDDGFRIDPQGFVQVFAGPGYDRAEIAGTATMTLVELTSASARVVLGSGADRRVVDLLAVEEVRLGGANDLVRLGGGVRVVMTEAGNDRATGFATDEAFWMGRGSDACQSGAGDDTIGGGDGNDWLWGADGNDRLRGGRGGDALFGGDGQDTLIGVSQDDTLTGGADADAFHFVSGDGNDRITDFEAGVDRVVLVGIDRAAVTLSQAGDDLRLDYGTGSVTFEGLAASALSLDDLGL